MQRCVAAWALLACAPAAFAQTAPPLVVVVTSTAPTEPLAGASVALVGTARGASADAEGVARLAGVAPGRYTLRVSSVGYESADTTVTLPHPEPLRVALRPSADEEDEIDVVGERSGRTLADTPTRVETIDAEEIDEKLSMDPSGLTTLLAESPGVVVQQTSPVTAAATFQIQGLDGRYTQLLRDGLPLYGGLGGSLSLLQVLPLDLARVELVKGPAGAVYGGDAIAGYLNLVTKRPPAGRTERSLLLNATSAGGADAALYLASGRGRVGYTLLAGANGQRAYDAEADGFTNLPASRRLSLAPTLFWTSRGGTHVRVGASATAEARMGGALAALDGRPGFEESTASQRGSLFAEAERALSSRRTLRVRASASGFHRDTRVRGTSDGRDGRFSGDQLAGYAEATLAERRGAHHVVVGLDLRTDRFSEHDALAAGARDYAHTSAGAFAQDTWDVHPRVTLETGLRLDVVQTGRVYALPRVAALGRLGGGWTLRGAAGLGYQQPTFFLETAEAVAFRGVAPLADSLRAERSVGGTLDLSYQGVIAGEVALTATAHAFRTDVAHALVLDTLGGRALRLRQHAGAVRAQGIELSGRLSIDHVKLFGGYVFLDATEPGAGGTRVAMPTSAAHRTYSVLVWEAHGRGRLGVEAYYTSPQRLTDGTRVPGYWITGVLGERRFGRVRVFVNLENLLDARQSRRAPLVTGSATAPRFAELWGPTDGRIVNGGVKIDL